MKLFSRLLLYSIIMTFGELLYQCDIEAKYVFIKFEKINKKIIDAKWSKTFNL